LFLLSYKIEGLAPLNRTFELVELTLLILVEDGAMGFIEARVKYYRT